jgi:sodium-dependent dicarboxylate transporter 2/3/5
MPVTHPEHDFDSGYESAGPEFSRRRKIGLLLGAPFFIFLLWPALTPDLSEPGRRLLATSGLMALWWITEAIPIPATALLPLCLFPLLGILPMAEVSRNYGDENIFLFLGGFLIAMAMQKWNLHRRLALHIIRRIGTSPRQLVLGFMCATAFLSMWLSNTATTMMMYPIALAVILQLAAEENTSFAEASLTPAHANFRTCMMLAIAYAASIGGIGTLIGTPPNIIFVSSSHKLFPEAPAVDFLQWLAFGLPLILFFLPIIWLLLTRLLFPVSTDLFSQQRELIDAEIAKLGRMATGERGVFIVFLLTALAWIFRVKLELGFITIPGWASALGIADKVSDATVAMIAGAALFVIPANFRRGVFLLDWKAAVKLPWGILLLFGGGIAMSAGFKSTGLSAWLGQKLALLGDWPPLAMIAVVCLMVTFLTEVTSNTATATIFMPIMAATAQALHMHPFLLMIPAAIAASCAFMLPVATPPNAIVFASGYVTVPQMARAGLWLNLIGVLLVTTIVYFLMIPVFQINLKTLPTWAQ